MADNLIFPIGFDLEKGVIEAGKDAEKYLRQLENALRQKPIRLDMAIDGAAPGSIDAISKRMTALSNEFNKLTEAQRVYNRTYCEFTTEATEYNTAVLRAAKASEWKQFEAEKDVLPNLRWVPSTSPDPGADHRVFWNTVRPVDDPFWSRHRPGDRWNCKCDLEPTDEPPTAVPSASGKRDEPSPGLENNPGKDGKLFSRKHPYFPKSCAACPFNSQPKLFALFADLAAQKDCEKCRAFMRSMERAKDSDNQIVPPHHEEYKEVKPGVFVHPMHGKNEIEENTRIAAFISRQTNEKVWLLPRLDPNNKEQNELRNKLLPDSVNKDKNPDFLIKGKAYECKSLMKIQDFDFKHVKNALENRIKKAKEQANYIILEIQKEIPYQYIDDTINNYLNRTNRVKEIRIIWNGYLKIKKAPDK